jgi:hypothetical protein
MSPGTANLTATPKPPPKKKGLIPPRFKPYLAPILITCILVLGEANFRILESYWHTGLAIVTAILLEIVLNRWVTGKWPHLASAYITGISVGILLRSNDLWPFVLCSMLAITSKYAIRVKGRHLFNPSNLGVSVLLLTVPMFVAPLSQQWSNTTWVLLIIMFLGTLILYSLGRLHISATYVAAFTVLSVVRSGLDNGWWANEFSRLLEGSTEWQFVRNRITRAWISEIGLITAPAYQLFIFFMITDPKTTTRTRFRQCAVAVVVAMVETILRLCKEVHAPYYALFIVAPVTNLLEIWWDARHPRKPAATTISVPAAANGQGTVVPPAALATANGSGEQPAAATTPEVADRR